jgi:hypothetical protein
MPVIDIHCSHCGQKLVHQRGPMWHGEADIAPQYCWVDPVHGSQLHKPAINLELSSEYSNAV